MERDRSDETCCCCIPIRNGVTALAVLRIISGLYTMLQGAASFTIEASDFEFKLDDSDHNERLNDVLPPVLLWNGRLHLPIGIIHVIMSMGLLAGVKHRIVGLLKLWVKTAVIFLVVFIIYSAIIILGLRWILWGEDSEKLLPITISLASGAIIGGAIELYYISVVHTYSKILKTEEEMQPCDDDEWTAVYNHESI